MLDVSVIEAGKLGLHDSIMRLADAVEAAIQLVRSRADNGSVQLNNTVGSGAPFMWHNATDIFQMDESEMGCRDIWIMATNRWSHRTYGDEFEESSHSQGLVDWDAIRPDESPQTTALDRAAPRTYKSNRRFRLPPRMSSLASSDSPSISISPATVL